MPDIRVLIADDHPVVRSGLRTFLDLQDGIEVVAEAADGAEAVRAAAEHTPDVVLMDLVMAGGDDGIEATGAIVAASASTKVIVLTSFATDDKVFPAIRAGAAGYLLKDVEPAEIANAIRRVHAGASLLHPAVAARLMRDVSEREQAPRASALTPRERDVLVLLARGLSNREIARRLGVAEKTVKTHVSAVLQKLHVADRTQAALYAVRHGIAAPD